MAEAIAVIISLLMLAGVVHDTHQNYTFKKVTPTTAIVELQWEDQRYFYADGVAPWTLRGFLPQKEVAAHRALNNLPKTEAHTAPEIISYGFDSGHNVFAIARIAKTNILDEEESESD